MNPFCPHCETRLWATGICPTCSTANGIRRVKQERAVQKRKSWEEARRAPRATATVKQAEIGPDVVALVSAAYQRGYAEGYQSGYDLGKRDGSA